MEDADRYRVLVAVGADGGGESRRLVGVIVDRVKPRECTAKLILYTKGVKVRQDIIVFST